MLSRIKVTVPASTANLGPGFDCLGLALSLFNSVEMWCQSASPPLAETAANVEGRLPDRVSNSQDTPPSVEVIGEGAGQLPEDGNNLILRAAARVFARAGIPMPALRAKATNSIPLASGLGSSAAAVIGGLVAANALLGGPLSRRELLGLAYEIEGHADNAAPALFGGLVIVSASGVEIVTQTVETPPMRVAIGLPAIRVSTVEARAALPAAVPMSDAVFNVGRAALVVKALERGDYDLLRRAMADRLHQPYRKRFVPGYDKVTMAARDSGAAAVALSGAGPSLVAFAPEGHETIARAMAAAFEQAGVPARTFVLSVDGQGVRVSPAGG